MTHTITAQTNDRARLIVKQACIINDPETTDLVRRTWRKQGYAVVVTQED